MHNYFPLVIPSLVKDLSCAFFLAVEAFELQPVKTLLHLLVLLQFGNLLLKFQILHELKGSYFTRPLCFEAKESSSFQECFRFATRKHPENCRNYEVCFNSEAATVFNKFSSKFFLFEDAYYMHAKKFPWTSECTEVSL